MLGGTGYVAVRLFYAGHWLVGSFAALSAFITLAWGGDNRICANRPMWFATALLHVIAGFFAYPCFEVGAFSGPVVLTGMFYAYSMYIQWKEILKD